MIPMQHRHDISCVAPALIRAHWKAILRIVASIRTGTVTASVIMRQLAAYPRQNGVAAV